jgi:hypothetical protein
MQSLHGTQSEKQTKKEMGTGGMAQVHMDIKQKALSSTPVTGKTIIKKE